jgi:hypothetical protein
MRIADALRTVDSAIRVVDLLHRSKDALRLREIYRLLIERAAAGASPEILSSIDDTLPPREQVVEDFVGREAELERLWSWLADSDSRRWVLCGDGGKGKTAIAYKFAYDVKLAGPTPICAVFWLSAKRRQYIEGQIRPISSPDFFDLDSALNKILSDYGFTEEVHQSSSAKKVTALGLHTARRGSSNRILYVRCGSHSKQDLDYVAATDNGHGAHIDYRKGSP